MSYRRQDNMLRETLESMHEERPTNRQQSNNINNINVIRPIFLCDTCIDLRLMIIAIDGEESLSERLH
jgi:hypothetical protein